MKNIMKWNETEYLWKYKDFINDSKNWKKKRKGKEVLLYLNLPMAFDIETSSFYNEDNEKQAIMYVWQFAIEDAVFMGRSWEDFDKFMSELNRIFKVDLSHRIIIYVHNLAYEFQFMRKHFQWFDIFAPNDRKPIYAVDINGNEYRCSYYLTNMSLAAVGKSLTKHKVEKMVGDLDYKQIRTPITPLTDKEITYCSHDVLVLTAYISEQIEFYKNDITKIPYTNTGRVRSECRKRTKSPEYHEIVDTFTITPHEYELMKDAFMGGFTHASNLNVMRNFNEEDNLGSFDFTSSYPTVLISEKFPMSKGVRCNIKTKKEFEEYLKTYCCIFRLKLKNIQPRLSYEHYLSFSKCFNVKDAVVDNGRIVSASSLDVAITNVDFNILKFSYDFEIDAIYDFYRYKKGYLPKEFIECVLEFYKQKTTLKGLKDKEGEYQHFKGMLNSIYGMTVMDIVRPTNDYISNEWVKIAPNVSEQIDKYNEDDARFIFYPWGIFCTAYARYNLWTGISEFKEDYIYSDTDSIKCKNYKKHLNYVNKYNENIKKKIEACLSYYNIPLSEYKPCNIKGEEKPMGVWDFEGEMLHFKTLGAKRYIYENKEGWHLTVAGTGKNSSLQYLLKGTTDPKSVMNKFTNKLCIPSDYTGKETHTYIDTEMKGTVVDMYGVPYNYDELSGIHLEDTSFNMSMSSEYLNYLLGVKVL